MRRIPLWCKRHQSTDYVIFGLFECVTYLTEPQRLFLAAAESGHSIEEARWRYRENEEHRPRRGGAK